MFNIIKNADPILVEVHDGRYDCYGDPTPHSQYLLMVLQGMGGIAESVEDGYYHFNVICESGKITATLTPTE